MKDHYSFHQSAHQSQQLAMNMAMRQAFDVLQMPIAELSDWINEEIAQNPLFEIIQPYTRQFAPLETTITREFSQKEYLFLEIRDHFELGKERKIAEYIGGALDERGFLTTSVKQLCLTLNVKEPLLLKILHRFQRMEPIGLGTYNVQEALLVQLEERGVRESTTYQIVKQCYKDLLHHRLSKIAKIFKLSIEALRALIYAELRPLTPFPGQCFPSTPNSIIIPDITIERENEMWKIEMNEENLPSFHIHTQYIKMAECGVLTQKDLAYLHRHLATGQWLRRVINQRKETLKSIMTYILKSQSDFLEGVVSTPHPMTMREIALALNRNESTITRAVANKYISCPLGLLKLRTLFTRPFLTEKEMISNRKIQELIIKLVKQEKMPLSDKALSKLLKNQGISCARRTIAKYRQRLKIPTALERRAWKRSTIPPCKADALR